MYSLSQVLLVTATKQELASTDMSRIAEEKVDLLGYWKRKFTMRNKYPCNFNQIIKKKKKMFTSASEKPADETQFDIF